MVRVGKTTPHRRLLSSGGDENHGAEGSRDFSKDDLDHSPLRLRGGVALNFPSMNAGQMNPYYRIKPGLNLKGKCCNQTCDLFDTFVWSHAGFQHSYIPTLTVLTLNGFNVGVMIHKAMCPACKETLQASTVCTCAFHECEYAFEGYRLDCKELQKGNGKAGEEEYEIHDEEWSLEEWTALTIAVRPSNYLWTVSKQAMSAGVSLLAPFLGGFLGRLLN